MRSLSLSLPALQPRRAATRVAVRAAAALRPHADVLRLAALFALAFLLAFYLDARDANARSAVEVGVEAPVTRTVPAPRPLGGSAR
jgi:hypothetical protein